jgi:hypothetical protein
LLSTIQRFNPAEGGLLDEPLLMQSNAASSPLEKLLEPWDAQGMGK